MSFSYLKEKFRFYFKAKLFLYSTLDRDKRFISSLKVPLSGCGSYPASYTNNIGSILA